VDRGPSSPEYRNRPQIPECQPSRTRLLGDCNLIAAGIPQQFRTFEIFCNRDITVSIFTTNVDPSVRDGSPAAKSRSYAIAAYQLFNLRAELMPGGSNNEMQEKIQNYGTPISR